IDKDEAHDNVPVTVTVSGFLEKYSIEDPRFADCDNPPNERVLRRSRQKYREGHILYLPMPLRYACFDIKSRCSEDETCKAGKCVSATTDENTLAPYDPSLADGTSGSCFPQACLA